MCLLPAKAKKTVEDKVKEYGGLVAAALNKQCTMLVLSEKDASGKYATQVAKARKLKVARVKPDYFDKCEEEEKLVDRSAYLIKTEEDEEEEEEEEEEEVKPPKAKAKAADDSDTMQVDPKSKKRKADSLGDEEDDATTATAATSSTTTASAATKKAKTELTTSSSSGDASAAADTYLQAKSVWSGVAEQADFDPCPLMLNMTARNGDDVSGTINWATLSTITKFRGTVSGNTLKIEEYEIITGDDVEVPNNYTATLGADGTLEGTFVDSHNESGHFKLTNTYHLPAPKDNFRAQSVWRGVAHVPFPFSMEVKTRSGNAFTGVVTWPTLENAQTKVKGTLANDQLKFEEFEVISGHDDIDVPNYFTCPLTKAGHDTAVAGSFKGEVSRVEEGTFKMEFVSPQ